MDAAASFYAIFHISRELHSNLFGKINSFLPSSSLLLVTMGSSEWEEKNSDFHGVEMWRSHYGTRENKEIVRKAGFEILLDEIDTTSEEKHQVILARKI